jgi:hypothetical protein
VVDQHFAFCIGLLETTEANCCDSYWWSFKFEKDEMDFVELPPDEIETSSFLLQPILRWSLTYLKLIIFGWFNRRKWRISVSFTSRTFFTATCSQRNLPRNTAPWAPLPNHSRSEILSKGISQSSGKTTQNLGQIFIYELRNFCKYLIINIFMMTASIAIIKHTKYV